MVDVTTIDELSALPVLEEVPPDQIRWIAEHGELVDCGENETLFRQGDPADYMFIILSGRMRIAAMRSGQRFEIIYEPGDVTGMLPFSRMKVFGGEGTALVRLRLFRMHRDHFQQLVEIAPVFAERLVAVMTNRVRDFSQRRQQQEKMMALGKLAAGLAHELNNPASAIQRDAMDLIDRTEQLDGMMESLCSRGMSPAYLARASAIHKRLNRSTPTLTTLQRSRIEDELAEWLEERGTKRSFELAETFVDGNLNVEDLENLVAGVPDEAQADLLNWIELRLATDQALRSIREAADRISLLVNSVKSYSHMDRSQARQEMDVHVGLDSTLTMLGHKLKTKSIRVDLDFAPDLPLVQAFGGELNQVWTNLIDNAIDAMSDGGRLRISTRQIENRVRVEIQDDGPGIPAEIQSRVFEPFFTTKEVGEGTGLGLDIVQRITLQHGGTIDVASEPGRTTFGVELRSEGS